MLLYGLDRSNLSSQPLNTLLTTNAWNIDYLNYMTYHHAQINSHRNLFTSTENLHPFVNIYCNANSLEFLSKLITTNSTYLFFSNVGSSIFNSYCGFGIVKLASIEFKELYQQNTQILVSVTACCLPGMQL